jgi:hypothetical protein
MSEFFSNPLNTFLIGLGIAVVLAAYVWFRGMLSRRELRKELQALKEQLHRQMTILDKGHQQTQGELDELRKQNENLRITNATLKNKPGRAEVQTLHVYEQALRLMQKRAPGFAPAWEDALAEAQRDAERADSGIVARVRQALRPAPTPAEPRQVTDAADATTSEPNNDPRKP